MNILNKKEIQCIISWLETGLHIIETSNEDENNCKRILDKLRVLQKENQNAS